MPNVAALSGYLAVPLLAAALYAPAVAHCSPMDDYVSRNGKAVCAAFDKVHNSGDVFRITLAVARDSGFSVKDAANIVGQSIAADCPWNAQAVKQTGDSAVTPAS